MDVQEWMKDNLELVVAVSLGLGAIIVSLLIHFWERKPKRLDYLVMYNAPLLPKRASGVRDLKVIYEESELKAPHLVTVRVKNTGKEPIKGDEYHQDITVKYSTGGPPLDASVPKESSPDLVGPPTYAFDDLEVSVCPGLLNAKDWFDLQILSDRDPGEITVSSRFVGQTRKMRDLDPVPKGAFRLMLFGLAIVAIGASWSLLSGNGAILEYGTGIGFGITFLAMLYLMYRIARVPADKNADTPGGFL